MGRTLRVLEVDQFLADSRGRSWLEWTVQHDTDGKPFIEVDYDGKAVRVNEGDFICTQLNGERIPIKHFDFISAVRREIGGGYFTLGLPDASA